MLKTLAGLGLALLLVACQKAPPSPADHAARGNLPGGIDWAAGSVDDAFATARREMRPVLLYWGAEWCPYCHTVKATVFNRPDFIAKTKLFVPVYLDGDDAGAQKWGEQFHIAGYPTLIILAPDRQELIRLGAGRDLAQYAAVLDLALEDLQPVDALLQAAAAGRDLTLSQCRRLAFNSWELDTLTAAESGQRATQLQTAVAHCPVDARQERATLTVYAANDEASAESDVSNGSEPMPSSQLIGLMRQVSAVLAESGLASGTAQALVGVDKDFFNAARGGGAEFASGLRDHFVKTMDAAASDSRYALADQLFFVDAKIRALSSLSGPSYQLPQDLLAAANARIDAALAAEQNESLRAGLIDASLTILEDVGDYQKAYQIANAEIGRSSTPYYYQADLAEIAEKLGHKDQAIDLFGEAYAGAEGTATRFQWGTLYLSGLLRLSPDDSSRIRTAGLQVLGELDGNDRIYRRARTRLERLDRQLRAWNNDSKHQHADVLRALRARMQQICGKIPAGEPARGSCNDFLNNAA